jgi:hypothetical protein
VLDVARLRKELEFVSAHTELWEQGCWIGQNECGTVACLAGWTVIHAGYEPYGRNMSFVEMPADDPLRSELCLIDGLATVDDVARVLLSLDQREASQLFHALNELPGLWRFASRLTDGEIEVPPEFAVRHDDGDDVR